MKRQEKGILSTFRTLVKEEKEFFNEQAKQNVQQNVRLICVLLVATNAMIIAYQIVNLLSIHEFRMVNVCLSCEMIMAPIIVLLLVARKTKEVRMMSYVVPIIYQCVTFFILVYIDVFLDPATVEIYMSKAILFAPILFALPYRTQLCLSAAQVLGYLALASRIKTPSAFRLDCISLVVAFFMALAVINYNLRFRHTSVLQRRKTEEEARANQAKTAFLNNVSHDIRTPLNVITGMLGIARANMDDPNRLSDCMDKIERSTEHLTTLVNDVLDVSKLESDEIILENVSFRLSKIRQDLGAMYVDMFSQKNITFHFTDEKMVYHAVYGSPLALKRIAINMLSNAYKYTKEGGEVDVTLSELSVENNTQTVEFCIRDNGVGMSKDFIENHLFQIFSREDVDLSSKGVNGSGLGMNITKRLVEKMGGTIEVESARGVGSTFIVTIPFEIDATCDKIIEEEEEEEEEAVLRNKHFLVAEDNELNKEILQFLLESEGATMDWAKNGKEAVTLFASHHPNTYDAILMDVNMPIMNGMEAAKEIRSLHRQDAKTIIILAVTANAFAEDVNRSLAVGMNGHINKPIDRKELKRLMNQNVRLQKTGEMRMGWKS